MATLIGNAVGLTGEEYLARRAEILERARAQNDREELEQLAGDPNAEAATRLLAQACLTRLTKPEAAAKLYGDIARLLAPREDMPRLPGHHARSHVSPADQMLSQGPEDLARALRGPLGSVRETYLAIKEQDKGLLAEILLWHTPETLEAELEPYQADTQEDTPRATGIPVAVRYTIGQLLALSGDSEAVAILRAWAEQSPGWSKFVLKDLRAVVITEGTEDAVRLEAVAAIKHVGTEVAATARGRDPDDIESYAASMLMSIVSRMKSAQEAPPLPVRIAAVRALASVQARTTLRNLRELSRDSEQPEALRTAAQETVWAIEAQDAESKGTGSRSSAEPPAENRPDAGE